MKRSVVTDLLIPFVWICGIVMLVLYARHVSNDPETIAVVVAAATLCLGLYIFALVTRNTKPSLPPPNSVLRYKISAATVDGYALEAPMNVCRHEDDILFGYVVADEDKKTMQVLTPYDNEEMYSTVVGLASLYGNADICLVVKPDGTKYIDLWNDSDSMLHAIGQPDIDIIAWLKVDGELCKQGFAVTLLGSPVKVYPHVEHVPPVPQDMLEDGTCVLSITPRPKSYAGTIRTLYRKVPVV